MKFNAQTAHDKVVIDKMREYAEALERGEGYLISHSVLCGRRESLTFSVNLRTGFGEASFEFTDFPNRRIFRAPPPTNEEMAEAARCRVHASIEASFKRNMDEMRWSWAQQDAKTWFAGLKYEIGDTTFFNEEEWICLGPLDPWSPIPDALPKEKPGIFGRAVDSVLDCLSFRSPI